MDRRNLKLLVLESPTYCEVRWSGHGIEVRGLKGIVRTKRQGQGWHISSDVPAIAKAHGVEEHMLAALQESVQRQSV